MRTHRALITGASGAIGSELAFVCADLGMNLILHGYRHHKRLIELKDELDKLNPQIEIETVICDLSSREAVKDLCENTLPYLGVIDVLINNAGIASQQLLQDLADEMWETFWQVNVSAALKLSRFVLPKMIEYNWGRIINISSVWGIKGASCEVAYSTTKAALIGFTKALAAEVAPTGVTVNCVAPGVIDTPMLAELGIETLDQLADITPCGRLGEPKDVAAAVKYFLSDAAAFVTGQILGIDGGFGL
ncbi:MAG: 3-oxoacyl-ACP reductase FabG [Clostridiaceae bacterium]|nr:3-oxoacyl-ACP reductase FabG [Clostridiaceae bacterium]